MPFHDAYSRPTTEQFALIGEIVTDAAIIDLLVCKVVARLAGIADFPGLAVMDRMFLKQRTEAADRLLELHLYRYRYQRITEQTANQGRTLMKRVRDLAATRNDAAHAILFRAGDDAVFAFKPQGKQGDALPSSANKATKKGANKDNGFVINGPLSNNDLRHRAKELTRLAGELEAFLALLPEVPEAPAG